MSSYIDTPNSIDILCGKDKTFQLHNGNRIYRGLIEEKAFVYGTVASKNDKMNMTQEIVAIMMHDHGSRFLRPVGEDAWEEITHQQARDKTSHALRFCAASLLRKTSQTTSAVKTTKRRRHRRTVSRDSNASSSSNSKIQHQHVPRVSWSDSDLFDRQQMILQQSLQRSNEAHNSDDLEFDDDEPIPVAVTSSEDLDIILSQPLNVHDWDGLFGL
jgi:hypothetical protein